MRIEIDPADLREHPLLVGLSAVVKVDTSDTSGRLLAASARTEPVPGDLVSQAPAVDFAPVEATISGIIRDEAGQTVDYLLCSNTANLRNYPASAYYYANRQLTKILGWND